MIYFDCAASHAPFPEALSLHNEAAASLFGNANSTHGFGFSMRKKLEEARKDILRALGVEKTHDLLFTSGATESNNLAIHGVVESYANRGKKILYSAVEHPSVSRPFEALAKEGFEVIKLPVNKEGYVEPKTLEEAMDKEVILVSIMGVNNETGTIFPIEEYQKILSAYPKAIFHSDMTQGIGKVNFPFSKIDLISFSGHKIGGLKGTGSLIFKKTLRLYPRFQCGDQEGGIRPGTVNVPGALSLAYAVKRACEERQENFKKESALRDYLVQKLSSIEEVSINSPEGASPYVLNFSLAHHKASVIVEGLSEKEIYVSSFSACNSKGEPVSDVLLAMGRTPKEAGNAIRVSMPLKTTHEEIDAFVEELQNLLKKLKTI